MYASDGRDVVTVIEDIPPPSAGPAYFILAADEFNVVVSYVAADSTAEHDNEVAFVRFRSVRTHIFGGPNDEALSGHPLYDRGLDFYSVHSIENSSLIRKLIEMNSIHPNHSDRLFDGLRHFLFTFEDGVFECVAQSFDVCTGGASAGGRFARCAELLEELRDDDD